MTTKILVPELGESVLEATVSRWLKKEGEAVNVGDVLVELETDKVNLEVGAKSNGVLAKIDVPEGGDVKVGEVLGTIDESAQPTEKLEEPAKGDQSSVSSGQKTERQNAEENKEPVRADGKQPQ